MTNEIKMAQIEEVEPVNSIDIKNKMALSYYQILLNKEAELSKVLQEIRNELQICSKALKEKADE